MNGYDFVAAIIGSLAWPATVLFCALLFRKRLNEIIHRLHLKRKDTEISFQIERAKDEAEKLPLPIDHGAPKSAAEIEATTEGSLSPESLILRKWNDLEMRIRNAYQEHEGLDAAPRKRSTLTLMNALYAGFGLNRAAVRTFEDLRSIRNRLVHGQFVDVPTMEHALEFAAMVDRVRAALEEMPSQEEIDAALNIPREGD